MTIMIALVAAIGNAEARLRLRDEQKKCSMKPGVRRSGTLSCFHFKVCGIGLLEVDDQPSADVSSICEWGRNRKKGCGCWL